MVNRRSRSELIAHPRAGYVLALVATMVTLLLLMLQSRLVAQTSLVMFSIPILISAYVGGLGPGLIATGISHLAAIYFLIPPTFSWRIATQSDHWLPGFITIAGIVISGLGERLHRRHRRHVLEQQRTADELQAALKENAQLRAALPGPAEVTVAHVAGTSSGGNDRSSAISGQSQTDDARQIIAERYRALFTFAPDGILIADPQNHLLDVNPSACRMLGYTREELIGQPVSRLVAAVDVPAMVAAPEKLREDLESKREWRLQRKDDSVLIAEVFSTVLPDGTLIGLLRDVSDRKSTDEILKTAAKEVFDLKAALDEHAIVAITDPRGRITYVNDRFCAISKYSREELIGQDHRIINSAHHPQEFIRDLWTTITEGRVWRGEIKNRAKDGSFYWVETTIVPFLNDHGKPRQYVAIRADITERKRVEEVAARLHAIEQANRLKTEFLANMSHELRTPLNGVIGFSEVLLAGKPGPLTATQRDFLDDILSSGRHLLRLINDVLDLSKVEAGKIELRPERFNVESAINEVCSVSRGIAQKRKIQIQIKIEAPLSEVFLDQQKFKQVLYNLISNAVKFNHDRGRVEVSARSLGHALQIQVRDGGIGIRATDLPRLFHEFEQLDVGTARRYGGTGLGLALTKKIVEAQRGTIGVESEIDVGSTFTVTLPTSENTSA